MTSEYWTAHLLVRTYVSRVVVSIKLRTWSVTMLNDLGLECAGLGFGDNPTNS